MRPVHLRGRVLFAGGAASTAFAFVWERVLRAGAVGQTGAGGCAGRRRRLAFGRILGAVVGIALGAGVSGAAVAGVTLGEGCSEMLMLFDMERVIHMLDRIDSLLCTLGAGCTLGRDCKLVVSLCSSTWSFEMCSMSQTFRDVSMCLMPLMALAQSDSARMILSCGVIVGFVIFLCWNCIVSLS